MVERESTSADCNAHRCRLRSHDPLSSACRKPPVMSIFYIFTVGITKFLLVLKSVKNKNAEIEIWWYFYSSCILIYSIFVFKMLLYQKKNFSVFKEVGLISFWCFEKSYDQTFQLWYFPTKRASVFICFSFISKHISNIVMILPLLFPIADQLLELTFTHYRVPYNYTLYKHVDTIIHILIFQHKNGKSL